MSVASAVQGRGEYERPGLGIVEPIDSPSSRVSAGQVGLRICSGVIRPDRQVAPRHPQIDAAEAEGAAHEAARQRVAQRDLSQLHEAAIFIERLPQEGERAVVVLEPVLIQYRAGSDSRTSD